MSAARPLLAARVAGRYEPGAQAVVYAGDCRDLFRAVGPGAVRLVVTSPPYNLGKSYERRTSLQAYLRQQGEIAALAAASLADGGSLCWQVGNFVQDNEVVPLDAVLYPVFKDLGLKLRNRIVWHFEHGLHCSRRLSGRHETILWFTKGDDYRFDVDPIRVPQKYPNKRAFKGPRQGELSCNPLGKNPGDVWIIPNVKANHIEKTAHPCQFPVELVERFVLALTEPGDLVLDPFLGAGTTVAAAVLHGRRGAGAEIVPEYARLAAERAELAMAGLLRTRPMSRPVYAPPRG